MMYLAYTTEIPLPDQNLGLYAVNSFVSDLYVKEAAEVLLRELLATCSPGTVVMIQLPKDLPSPAMQDGIS